MNSNSLLVSVPSTAKMLGLTKKAVLSLIDTGILTGITACGDTYIVRKSIENLFEENKTVNSGQHSSGFVDQEELPCLLTKSNIVIEQEKAGKNMVKGYISTLSDNRFMVQIDLGKTPEGKRKRENKSFRDKCQAELYLESRLKELNQNDKDNISFVNSQSSVEPVSTAKYTQLTFEQYAIKLLNSGVGKATTRTLENYRRHLKYVLPYIGKKKMVDVTEQDIRKIFEKLRYDYVKSGIKYTFKTVRLVFLTALDNNEIPCDIMRKLKCPTSKKPISKDKYPIFSDEDVGVLLKTSKEYSLEIYTMFAVLECTGLRPGELRGLEWECFNAESKTIHIKQAVTLQYEEITTLERQAKYKDIISTTKSEYSVRTLRLSDLAVQALQEWRKYVSKSRSVGKRDSKLIFSDKSGGIRSETSYQRLIQRYRKDCNVESMGVHLYKFRHTMCTRLILAGQPIPVIQRIMGDNTPDVITKIYTHVSEQMAMKATESFYNTLNKKHIDMMM